MPVGVPLAEGEADTVLVALGVTVPLGVCVPVPVGLPVPVLVWDAV